MHGGQRPEASDQGAQLPALVKPAAFASASEANVTWFFGYTWA